MSRHKHRQIKKPTHPQDSNRWLEALARERMATLSKEKINEKIIDAERQSHRLLAEPELADLPLDGETIFRLLLAELEWYQDGILSQEEKERWWYCHVVRENVLLWFVREKLQNDLYLRLVACLKLNIDLRGPEQEDGEKIMLILLTIIHLTKRRGEETWSLYTELIRKGRRTVAVPGDLSDPIKRCLVLFEHYETLGEESPYLKWIYSGGKPPFPHPFPMDEETERLLEEMVAIINYGAFKFPILSNQDMHTILKEALKGGGETAEEGFAFMKAWFGMRMRRAIRSFLWELRKSERWEEIRMQIGVWASQMALSTEASDRQYGPHVRAVHRTLDYYYRGEHPILSILLQIQMKNFIQEMNRNQRKGGAPLA